MDNYIKAKTMKMKLYFLLILINLLLTVITYKIMPIIQNYPPNSENITFQKSVEAFSHIEQYALIFIIGTTLEIITLNRGLKNICKFLNKYNKEKNTIFRYSAGSIEKGLFLFNKAIHISNYETYKFEVVFNEDNKVESTYIQHIP